MIPIALMLALASSQAAPSETTPPLSAAAKVAKATAAPDPIECHEQVTTGSHFPSRTCLHHSEWMRLRDASLEGLTARGRDRQPGLRPN